MPDKPKHIMKPCRDNDSVYGDTPTWKAALDEATDFAKSDDAEWHYGAADNDSDLLSKFIQPDWSDDEESLDDRPGPSSSWKKNPLLLGRRSVRLLKLLEQRIT